MFYLTNRLRKGNTPALAGWAAIFLLALSPQVEAQLTPEELAERYPPRVEDLRPTLGWAPQFERTIVEAVQATIPLQVDWGDNTLNRSQVTFGIPFPRGALASSSNARIIDGNGNPIPAGFTTTATWDGPEGPVRWALVNTELHKGTGYFVEYGTAVEAFTDPIVVAETADAITITTGPMQATICRIHPSVVKSVILKTDGADIFSAADERIDFNESIKLLPTITDASGTIYTATNREQGLVVEVVESGPQRVAIRREGWYADASGDRFCQFITYTYFYSGQTELRHDHTTVVAFDTNEHRIRDINLPVPLRLARDAQAIFASDASPDGKPIILSERDGPYSLIQSAHNRWQLNGPKGEIDAGSRAGGWYGLASENGGVIAGLRDFWQQFPAQLETCGNVVNIHLWPDQGVDPLCLRPSTQLGDNYPGNHRLSSIWYVDGLDEMTQGYGVAKTHTISLNFFAGPDYKNAWLKTRAQTVAPVLALPNPEWTCSTDVLYGRVHPYDPERFPEIEAMIDSIVDFYHRQREDHEQYGWIHFGDVYNSGDLWRRWGSMFYGFPNVMPRLYLRSGERDKWDFHRVNTRHITDIDICHLTSDAFVKDRTGRQNNPQFLNKIKGMRYGGDGGIAHYAADLYGIGPDHHLEFMLMDYYINGNLRTWEVANYYLQAHADRRDAVPMVGYQHRSTGGALRLFAQGYQATWNHEYLSIMRQIAAVLYQAQEKQGALRHDDVYMNPSFVLFYQLTGDQEMRELFLSNMSTLSKRRNVFAESHGGRGATLSGLSNAYWFTGDEKFLPFMLWQLEKAAEGGTENLRGNRLAINSTHAYQLPEVMSVLAAVTPLPSAKGPAMSNAVPEPLALSTNWAIYLLQEEDGPFTFTTNVDLYRSRHGNFYNWREWVEALSTNERPAIRVLDPDGEEILVRHISSNDHNRNLDFKIEADGKVGTYTIVPANMVVPMRLRLTAASLDQRVFHADDNWTNPGRNPSYYFTVPAGTGDFTIAIKTERVRYYVHYGVRNQDGEVLAENRWDVGSSPRSDWEIIELDAGNPGEDEVWSLVFQVPTPQSVGPTAYLRFAGVPSYVASSPEELFVPDSAVRQHLPTVIQPEGKGIATISNTGLPWGGDAIYLGSTLSVQPENTASLLNEDQGTLEVWLRTTDAYSSLRNWSLLSAGTLRLDRRYNIGTYSGIDGKPWHRFFIFPTNRWTHFALTWQPSEKIENGVELRMFADGVEVKDTAVSGNALPDKVVSPGWSQGPLQISSGLMVGGLRISNTVRYGRNFERPTAPFEADTNTMLLLSLDGSGEDIVIDAVSQYRPNGRTR